MDHPDDSSQVRFLVTNVQPVPTRFQRQLQATAYRLRHVFQHITMLLQTYIVECVETSFYILSSPAWTHTSYVSIGHLVIM